MTREEIHRLIGGYATGNLSEAQRRLLFEAALDDQDLFDELARDQALKELLELPGVKQRLLGSIEARPARVWWKHPLPWAMAVFALSISAMLLAIVYLTPSGSRAVTVAKNEPPPGRPGPVTAETPAAPSPQNQPSPQGGLRRDATPPEDAFGAKTTAAPAAQSAPPAPSAQFQPAPRETTKRTQESQQAAENTVEKSSARDQGATGSLDKPATPGGGAGAPGVGGAAGGGAPASVSSGTSGGVAAAGGVGGTGGGGVRGATAPGVGGAAGGGGGASAGQGAIGGGRIAGALSAPAAAPAATQASPAGPAPAPAPPPARAMAARAAPPAGRFAFDYSIYDGVLRIVPAADGYLLVRSTVRDDDRIVLRTSHVTRTSPVELRVPDGASSLLIVFSARPVAEDSAGETRPPVNSRADASGTISGTLEDPRPSVSSRLEARIPLSAK